MGRPISLEQSELLHLLVVAAIDHCSKFEQIMLKVAEITGVPVEQALDALNVSENSQQVLDHLYVEVLSD